jgi:hypothetical protein
MSGFPHKKNIMLVLLIKLPLRDCETVAANFTAECPESSQSPLYRVCEVTNLRIKIC